MMRKYISLLFLVFVSSMLLQGEANAKIKLKPIYNPPAMSLAGDLSTGAVKEAILRATANRGWRTKKIGKRKLRATFKKTGKVGVVYTVVVDITYSKNKINFKYHSSRDLNYQKESQLIGGHYNSWLKKLEREIWKEVNR